MSRLQPGRDQRLLGGEGTAQQEGDEVVAPDIGNIGNITDGHAIAENAVLRQVAADISTRRAVFRFRVSRLQYLQHRTRLRIIRTELSEFFRIRRRQDHHVGLHKTLGMAGRRAVECAAATGRAQIARFCVKRHGVPYPPPPGVSIT